MVNDPAPEEDGTATLTLQALTGDRTMLVLAASPGDESIACGGLIAEACARGRPPLVAVLSDGASLGSTAVSADARAVAHERETRQAVHALGLPSNRLLMLGVRDDVVPGAGAFFDQIVEAVGFLTWMRDLNIICGPREDNPAPIQSRTGQMAAAIARSTGIGLLRYGAGPGACAIAVSHASAKARAIAAHATLGDPPDTVSEWFTVWHGG